MKFRVLITESFKTGNNARNIIKIICQLYSIIFYTIKPIKKQKIVSNQRKTASASLRS